MLVHRQQHRGLLGIGLSLHDLIVVIDLDIGKDRTALHKIAFHALVVRHILHIEAHERLLPLHDRYGDMADLVVMVLMREDVLALRPPDRLDDQSRPEFLHIDALLRLKAERLRQAGVKPLQAAVLAHDENGLRQALYGVSRHLADVLHDAPAVTLEPFRADVAPLFSKQGQADPDDKGRPREDAAVGRQKADEHQHDDQLDREIHPCRHIARHVLTSFLSFLSPRAYPRLRKRRR